MEVTKDNRFFRLIGFTKDVDILLKMDSSTFKECFLDNVSDDVNFFGVSKHKKAFDGRIKGSSFEMSKSSRTNSSDMVFVTGVFEDHDGHVKVQGKVFIPLGEFLFGYSNRLLVLVFFWFSWIEMNNVLMIVGTALFLSLYHWLLWTKLKKEVANLKHDVEREFGYWLAKSNDLQISYLGS
jgi:hypothetical protein